MKWWRAMVALAILGLIAKTMILDYEVCETRKALRALEIHEDCFYTNQMHLNRILVDR